MIEFLTLLLGLSAGPQTVRVSAAEEVAEVHLLLDGETVARDESPPWTLSVDLGTGLRPLLLEAIALDESGTEIARAEQLLNVPRPAAEARIVLEKDASGRAVAARLNWETVAGSATPTTRAWLDGELIEVTDPNRIPLPTHDPSVFHVLRVELEFTSEILADAQVAFGGTYLDETSSALTALPVRAAGGGRRARARQMKGWFQVGDETATVVAVEKGTADLVVVRGPGATQAFRYLPGLIEQGGSITMTTGGLVSLGNVATADQRLQEMVALEDGRRLRLLLPEARRQKGRSVAMEVFALSPDIPKTRGGLAWALQHDVSLDDTSRATRLADAVAVAAMQVASNNRRRAVLLVLAEDGIDASRHSEAEVRDYLEALHVPLVVWRVGEGAAASFTAWGSGIHIDGAPSLRRAARKLRDEIEQQRIVWLDGHHLPHRIRFAGIAKVTPVAR